MKKFIVLFLICILSINTIGYVYADEKTEEDINYTEEGIQFQKNRLANIQREITLNQTYITELNKKNEYLSEEVQKLDNYILEIQEEIDSLNAEIEAEDNQLDAINNSKKKKIEDLQKIKNEYNLTKQAIIDNSSVSDWLATADIKEIKRRTNTILHLSSSYSNVLKKQNNILSEMNATVSLSTLSSAAKKDLKSTIEKKQAVLLEQQNKKVELIYQHYNSASIAGQEIADLEDVSEEVSGIIQKLQSLGYKGSGNLLKGKGVLSYPCEQGRLTSDYGMRIHPITGKRKMHTGIDIGGNPTGTPVLASADGIVITSGWISGYGYTVIVDHGNNVSTLYAHNSKLVAKVGQVVERGQTIAKVGSTGNSTGPHIHFEVRVNGKTTDPKEWL